jgi:hypothetical protein
VQGSSPIRHTQSVRYFEVTKYKVLGKKHEREVTNKEGNKMLAKMKAKKY